MREWLLKRCHTTVSVQSVFGCSDEYSFLQLQYGEKFLRDKIFAVFTDLPQTVKILTAKFCDCRALCFVIVEP